jgi:hypothetical protein
MKIETEPLALFVSGEELGALGRHLSLHTTALSPLNSIADPGPQITAAAAASYNSLNLDEQTAITAALRSLANPLRKLLFHYTTSERNLGRLALYWPAEGREGAGEGSVTALGATGSEMLIGSRSLTELKHLINKALAVEANPAALNFSINISAPAALILISLADCYREAWHRSMLGHSLPESSYTLSEVVAQLSDQSGDFRWPLQFFKEVLPLELPGLFNDEELAAALHELEALDLIVANRDEGPDRQADLYTLANEGVMLAEGFLNNAGKVALTMTVLNSAGEAGHEAVLLIRDPFYLWLINLSGSMAAVSTISEGDLAALIEGLFTLKAREETELVTGPVPDVPPPPFPPKVETVSVPAPPPPVLLPAPFLEMLQRHAALKDSLDRGTISAADFLKALESLRLQGTDGTWWQLNDDGKSWLKWDGSGWVSAEPQ